MEDDESDPNMLLVYLMDRFVWMLLITVVTTAVLQQCGVVAVHDFHDDESLPLQDTFQFEMEPEHRVFDYAIRQKRQQESAGPGASPVIDGIFNPSTRLSAACGQPQSVCTSSSNGPPPNRRPQLLNEIVMDSVVRGVQPQRRPNIARLNIRAQPVPTVDAYI